MMEKMAVFEERDEREYAKMTWNVDGSDFLEYGLKIDAEFSNPDTGVNKLVSALIDTGSNRSGIDLHLAQELGLEESNETMVESFSGSSEHRLFKGILRIPEIKLAIGGRFIGLGIAGLDAVIGRDVLGFCELCYNGESGRATVARTA